MAKKHQIKISSKKGRRRANRKWRRQQKMAIEQGLTGDVHSGPRRRNKKEQGDSVRQHDVNSGAADRINTLYGIGGDE